MEARRYEMVVVADPTIPEAAHDEQVSLLENLIAELGGVVRKVDVWGRMKLAYPIGNHTEGSYTLYLYDGQPDVEKELIRRIKLSDTYMRFLSIRADHEEAPDAEQLEQLAEARKAHIKRAEERAAEAAAPPAPVKKEEKAEPDAEGSAKEAAPSTGDSAEQAAKDAEPAAEDGEATKRADGEEA